MISAWVIPYSLLPPLTVTLWYHSVSGPFIIYYLLLYGILGIVVVHYRPLIGLSTRQGGARDSPTQALIGPMQVTAPPHRREESEEIRATGQSEQRMILKNIRSSEHGASNNRIDTQ